MNYNETLEYKRALIGQLGHVEWSNPYALTLSLKPTVRAPEGGRIPIELYSADQNVWHFTNMLRGKLFSSQQIRLGADVKCVAVAERTQAGRLHYHLIIDVPACVTHVDLGRYIARTWPRTTWGDKQVDVQLMTGGWIDYICKFRSKLSYADAFRFGIFRLPT